MEREIKTEQGDWGSLVFVRKTYTWSPPKENDWKMITEDRDGAGGFDTPIDCCQNADQIVCPYCKSARDACESEDFERGEHHCYECEKDFKVEASFGYGFTSSPKECKHHDFVFGSQYAYFTDGRWTTWRIMECKNCEQHLRHCWPKSKYQKVDGMYKIVYDKQPLYTLLPWLDEYNDPDFFDPEGVLKTGVDLTEEYETPILDFLRKRKPWELWHYRNGAQRAIEKHEKAYGELL